VLMLGASRRRLWDRAFIFPKSRGPHGHSAKGALFTFIGAQGSAQEMRRPRAAPTSARCCPSRAASRTNLPLAARKPQRDLSFRSIARVTNGPRSERANTVVTDNRNKV
jgi:hypothetical protein